MSGTAIFTTVDEELARQKQQSTRSWMAMIVPAAALGLTLIGLVSLALYLSRPYTADQLYAHIATHTDSEDVESIRQMEREIKEFVAKFPNDSRAAELRQLQQRVELERMSRRLQLQSRRGGLPDLTLSPVEVLYLQAINTAQTSPEEAIKMLESLVKLYRADAKEEPAQAAAGDADRRSQCVKLAEQQLAILQSDMAKQTSRHLAAIRDRLGAATKAADRDPDRARAMLQSIIDLYGKDDWASGVVDQARRELTRLEEIGHEPENHQ
jgi:serine/threonine-protein kinase